jgi:hypothetical protein
MRPRWYSAHGRHEGLEDFIFGSVTAEGFEEARTKLAALYAATIPGPLPQTFYIIPGSVVFTAEDHAAFERYAKQKMQAAAPAQSKDQA